MYRNTFALVDNSKLKENIKEIINKYDNYKYYIGVVKANAYGQGDYIINDLIDSGINYLAVSSLEEALSIRRYNKEIPILCLEVIDIKYLDVVIYNSITMTISSLDYVLELVKENDINRLKVHLKLDVGMNRLGLKDRDEVNKVIRLLEDNEIYLEGIYTHFPTSGINDRYYEKGLDKFRELTKDIDLDKIEIVHLDRSITLVHHDKIPFATGVRLGIIMYGFNQSIKLSGIRRIKRDILNKIKRVKPSILDNDLRLSTVFSLYTTVMEVKRVYKGEIIGYGTLNKVHNDMVVAILPIGYVDFSLPFVKYVSINNKRYSVVGVCMDMTIIEVDDSIKVGDTVELFGNDISIKEVTQSINKNAYQVLTSVGSRVPRVYSSEVEISYGREY